MKLVRVTKELEDLYSDYYLDLIKIYEEQADKLGIVDNVCKTYTKERALKHLRDCECFIIFDDTNTSVGMLTYKFLPSENRNVIVEIKALFIEEKQRCKGYGSSVIQYLKFKFNELQLKCWYGLQAESLYKALGFKELYKVMMYE